MKEHTLLRAHLLNKFDELPINGNSVSDWKKMEKALQIAMPIGLLSLVLFGKGSLLSKKLMWIWISIATCGGAATTLAVYQSRQASLAPASSTVNKYNRPKPGSSTLPVVASVNDTTISKKHKTKKVLRNVAGTSVIKSKRLILKDTVVRPLFNKLGADRADVDAYSLLRKKSISSRALIDTSLKLRKNLRPTRPLMDTSLRLRKNLRPVRPLTDTSLRMRKNLRPARTLTDTSLRLRKNLKPTGALMDNSLRLRKTLTTTRPLRDTSLRLRKTLTTSRTLMDTPLRLRKTLTTSRTLMDTSLRLRKNLRPTRTLRDTLVRPGKLPKR
jgi:hypothetical protein